MTKHSTPDGGPFYRDFTLPGRFWDRVELGPDGVHSVTGENLGPCWLWTGAQAKGGYPQVRFGGPKQSVHRVTFAAFVHTIERRDELDHLCRVRHCCRPEHLEIVAHKTNMERGAHAAKTHCKLGHPYDEENTRVYVHPVTGLEARHCLACEKIRNTGPVAKKREARTHCRYGHPLPPSVDEKPRRCPVCAAEKGRRMSMNYSPPSYCSVGHEMTPENMAVRERDGRYRYDCRTCERERTNRSRANRRSA